MFMNNFWYAVEASPDVTDEPTKLTLINKHYVLYRNQQGEVIALDDRCPHRGASLALGWVENNCIRCPYHGWSFESDGHCSSIPADESGTRIPARAKVSAHPIQERYGIVWMFVGDPELPAEQRPSLPEFPQFDNPERPPCYSSLTCDVNYTRTIEISIDSAHAPFVHKKAIGKPYDPKKVTVERYQIKETEWGFSTQTAVKVNRLSGINRFIFDQDNPDAFKRYAFAMPNVTYTAINFGKLRLESLMFHVPMSENKTVFKAVNIRNFLNNTPLLSSAMDHHVAKTGNKILIEDDYILREQQPMVAPYADSRSELLIASDATIMNYRKLLRKYTSTQDMQRELAISNALLESSQPNV